MKTNIQGIKSELKETNVELQVVKSEQQAMKSQINHRFDTLETQVAGVHEDVTSLKTSVNGMVCYAHEDVVALVKTIDGKLQDND